MRIYSPARISPCGFFEKTFRAPGVKEGRIKFMNQEHKNFRNGTKDFVLIIFAFVLWALMFRGYLSGKVALFDDAISYYDHIKFYLDNISRGVFPLWDPLWFCGNSNTFFLQRMGCFNPFLLFTLAFKSIGFSYTTSYLIYLMLYYFVGCVGFYLLARCVIKDRVCSFVAFLMLLYSALGTRNFDSFMILMFTPIVWFFYFLVAFSQKPRRYAFVGMVVALIMAATTYIPFYFLLSVFTFIVLFVLIYATELRVLIPQYLKFIKENKMLVALCLFLLAVSLAPGYLFFKAGGKGDYVMPMRNTSQAVGSVLGVQAQDSSNSWALLEELFFARYYYTDITLIEFAIIYVPLFAGIIFLLGFVTKINKKILLLFLWISALLLICIPKVSPVYAFFYEHVSFFKYFRNLHFYLWVTILPAVCLLLGLQFKSYLAWRPIVLSERLAGAGYIVIIHAALAWLLWHNQYPVVTSYFVLILSCVFFLWRLFGTLERRITLTMVILLLVAALEPWEIYGYLSQNTRPYQPYAYTYDSASLDFHYVRDDNDVEMAGVDTAVVTQKEDDRPQGRVVRSAGAFYYASKWFSYLSANVDMYVMRKYRSHKFIIYDAVERLDDNKIDFAVLETALAENRNVAFVSTDDPAVVNHKTVARASYYARTVDVPASDFYVEAFDANRIRIKTNFAKPQFVVYNDNDHREWRVWIDGKEGPVVRSNVAFKGVWVPAGQQTVEFKYGSPKTWGIYMFLFVGINGLFVMLLYLSWREFNVKSKDEDRQAVF